MKKFILSLLLMVFGHSLFSQNVGIGTTDPKFKLDVVGNFHTTTNAFIEGSLAIGSKLLVFGSAKLQVRDGAILLYNSTDGKQWYFDYTNEDKFFSLSESGLYRLVVQNGGNVGIGTYTPGEKLDVNGNLHVAANANIEANLTVNGGKGIMRNSQATGQLKYYTVEQKFDANLSGFELSPGGILSFGSAAGFTTAPSVMVGDIVSTGGTVGELYRVQLILYGCGTTSCRFKLLNTSPNAVKYSITWNIICIGN